jgi:hypothetical protein
MIPCHNSWKNISIHFIVLFTEINYIYIKGESNLILILAYTDFMASIVGVP